MNSFGSFLKINIFGESHGESVGICVDNCPAGIPIGIADFEADLGRRKSGAKGTTPRLEGDVPELISGVFNGFTTGAPITILFKNTNTVSKDYSNLIETPRPGHADFTGRAKFGRFVDYRGGGHFSGRLTLALVAAGVIAKKICSPIVVTANLIEAGGNKNVEAAIEAALANGDSIGGLVACHATNVPVGLGEPFFDSVESVISHLAFSIPAVKGIEFGSGFEAAKMTGSEHNDAFIEATGKTIQNKAGGINGGITNGNDLVFRVAIKPTSSIAKPQTTLNMNTNKMETLEVKGRHDVCIALRVPVVLEAITALALADLLLLAGQRNRVYNG
jgi:chorismate synthase